MISTLFTPDTRFEDLCKLYMNDDTVELQWLEHFWDHEKMFEIGVARASECFHSARPEGIIGLSFLFSLI